MEHQSTSDSSSDTSTASYASDSEQKSDLLAVKKKKNLYSVRKTNSAYLLPPTTLVGVNKPVQSESIAKLKALTNGDLRKGKWSKEEEEYTQIIINAFQIGK
jgi:hypothetical protein